ncbi:MAG: zinc ABC transporter substrate-binding protein [Verrucomicrobiales bacterium]|nr:zinc ABC transporter substrate-binding protein [Verrucomicrobiales bacterium]
MSHESARRGMGSDGGVSWGKGAWARRWAGCLAVVLGGLWGGMEAWGASVRVATTVTMVTDMVKAVGGDRVEVQGLMGPGVDPHLYRATAADLRKLQMAQVIFYSGLHLEGKLQEVLARVSKADRPVLAVTDSIPRAQLLQTGQGGEEAYDPHVWFDVPLWSRCIETVVKGLTQVDPAGAADYERRAAQLRVQYAALHTWALERAAVLPPQRRILVTSHDAFNYFGRAYGFKVVALQGISTVTEAGLADVTRLVDFVKSNRVAAVFVESSVSPAAMRRIEKDSGATIGGELFSDAMGTSGTIENGFDVGTYEGMIRHNLVTIVKALKGDAKE